MIRLIAAATASVLLASSALADSAMPTDPQIAHIAHTAGTLDIEAAKQALSKSHNPNVVAFANEMVRDHSAVNDKALALVKKLHVNPEANATSASLTTTADAERATLARLNGAAFDKAYVDNEVAYHKAVNGALRDTLIPNSQNAELKAFLGTGLKLFEQHQAHAEMLAAKLK